MAEEPSKLSLGCIGALVLLIAPLALMWFLPSENPLGTILAIGWILVSIPVAIVVFLDWFRSSPKTLGRRILRNVARVPVFALGAIAVLFGVSIVAWVAYNLLWERQPGFRISGLRGSPLAVLLVFFGLYLVKLSLSRSEPG